ncbi:MAG: MAPEG family protein [Asticcacaulis sp.]
MPNTVLILWPVGALAALTFAMLLAMLITRLRAVKAREVSPRDFALGETERVPRHCRLINRNYSSLLELPVLFYVVCGLMIEARAVSDVQLGLAWAFVGFRLLHSLIHVTINHVLWRLLAFGASVVVLAAMWVLFFVRVA